MKGFLQSLTGAVTAILLLIVVGAGGDGKVTSDDKADFIRGLSPWRTYIHDLQDEIIDAKGNYNKLIDKLNAMQSGPLSAIQWTASGQTPTFVDSDTFTVPTDMTDKFEVGRRVKAELVAGNFVYSNVSSSSFASNTTTINLDATNLTSNLSTVSYSFLDAGSDHSLPTDAGVPLNGIIFTTDATCPTGFTEYTTARGRFLVGVPASGTNEGTVGTALTNLQDKTHTHTYTDVPNHVHSVDPPSTSVSVTDPGHAHNIELSNDGTAPDTADNGAAAPGTITSGVVKSNTTGITASVDVTAFNSANPTGGVATGTTATTALSTSWPYIQLRLCKKS